MILLVALAASSRFPWDFTKIPELDLCPPMCCEAMTAPCMACKACQSLHEFCDQNPDTFGCRLFGERPKEPRKEYNGTLDFKKAVESITSTIELDVNVSSDGFEYFGKKNPTIKVECNKTDCDIDFKISQLEENKTCYLSFDDTVANVTDEKVDFLDSMVGDVLDTVIGVGRTEMEKGRHRKIASRMKNLSIFDFEEQFEHGRKKAEQIVEFLEKSMDKKKRMRRGERMERDLKMRRRVARAEKNKLIQVISNCIDDIVLEENTTENEIKEKYVVERGRRLQSGPPPGGGGGGSGGPPPNGGGGIVVGEGTPSPPSPPSPPLIDCASSSFADKPICKSWVMSDGSFNNFVTDATSDVTSVGISGQYLVLKATGLPSHTFSVTQETVDALNARQNAATDFATGVTTAVAGTVLKWGDSIGFNPGHDSACGGFWPPGPQCPGNMDKTVHIPLNPSAATQDCFTGMSAIGVAANGVSIYGWADGQSSGSFTNVAAEMEKNDISLCLEHAANNDAHYHLHSPCLMNQLGDDGTKKSPVFGYAADGYPILGPYVSNGVTAKSCWMKRDYSDPNRGGCDSGKRTCKLNNNLDLHCGTTTDGVQAGPDPAGTVTSQSGNVFSAASGIYYEDFYFNSTCAAQGGEYLDAFNTRMDEVYGRVYHITFGFPYNIGPVFYGSLHDNSMIMGGCQTTQGSSMGPPGGRRLQTGTTSLSVATSACGNKYLVVNGAVTENGASADARPLYYKVEEGMIINYNGDEFWPAVISSSSTVSKGEGVFVEVQIGEGNRVFVNGKSVFQYKFDTSSTPTGVSPTWSLIGMEGNLNANHCPPPPPVQVGVGASCSAHPNCAALGLNGECCPVPPNAGGIRLGCCEPEVVASSPPPTTPLPPPTPHTPPNLAACSAHTQCAELGLGGDCCPNSGGVRLGCCNAVVEDASPPPPKPPPPDLSLCSAHTQCAELGLGGSCCPNAGGVRLGCCDAIVEESSPPSPSPHPPPVVSR